MPDKPTTYLQACWMEPSAVASVRGMIASHTEFSGIGITTPDRETCDPFLAKQIPEGKVLVIFAIPYEGIYMPHFFGEFNKILNQESTVATQGERER